MSDLLSALREIVGPEAVLARPEDLLVYEADGLTVHGALPSAVVLPSDKTEVARFAERDGCGIAADPDSPEAVAGAVRGVLGDPARLARMGRKSRDLAVSYDRVKQLQIFVQAIEEARPA